MKKKEELSFDLDMSAIDEIQLVMDSVPEVLQLQSNNNVVRKRKSEPINEDELISCLRNEKIEVKFIELKGKKLEKNHPFHGGLGEGSTIMISVPKLRSGNFANVLTNSEKKYLEYVMGLEDGALGVYNRVNNFWSNSTEGGISYVLLKKRNNILDLSIPEDYIRYKILLSDKDHICPNLQTLRDKPKLTYKFVIISKNETSNMTKNRLDIKKKAYVEYSKIENDYYKLKTILEMITYKQQTKDVSIEFLQEQILLIIDDNARPFIDVISDKMLDMKILIKKAVDNGIITRRANQYYLAQTREPLCDAGEESTLSIAAKYLSLAKNQEMKFMIEGLLNNM